MIHLGMPAYFLSLWEAGPALPATGGIQCTFASLPYSFMAPVMAPACRGSILTLPLGPLQRLLMISAA